MNEKYLRFGLYKHNLVLKLEVNNELLVTKQFIVLKDSYDNIVGWTNFHRYIKGGKNKKTKHISDNGNNRFYYIIKFLNYSFFGKYQIDSLKDINKDIIKDFLNDYGKGQIPEDQKRRNKTTVEICINYIIDFIECLIKENEIDMKVEDLYKEVPVFNPRRIGKGTYKKKVPVFDVVYTEKDNQDIFRDMPNGVFEIFMNQILEKHPRLLMLASLGAFGGLRPSEACNVFREDSPICKGLIICYENGKAYDISIDINEERVMRSDLISVGKIKKERIAKIYPAFINSFMSCYEIYLEYLQGKPYEKEYAPLTVNSQGKAITYDSYYKEFQEVVAECIPILLSSDDKELVNYGHLLMENNISPHIFRHWFSVQLTLMNCDVAALQYWRGDQNPESSLVYLQNKGELIKKYTKVENEIFNYQYWKANKLFNL